MPDDRRSMACGLTLTDHSVYSSTKVSTIQSEPPREEGRRVSAKWWLTLGLAPVALVVLAAGWAGWRHYERLREDREQVRAEQARQLAETEREQAEQAERVRQAEAVQKRETELLNRVPEVNARARDYLRRGDFTTGLSVISELLRQIDSPELLETKVDLLNNAGRWNEAYLELQKLLKLRPAEAYLHAAAANFAQTLTGPAAALPHLDSAAKREPRNSRYQVARANRYILAGRVDEGLAQFEQLIADDPSNIDAWYSYGDSLYGVGRYEQAVELFRRAVQQFPESSRHWFLLGLALDAWGNKVHDRQKQTEAALHYRKSLELHPMARSTAAKRIFEVTGERVPPELETLHSQEFALESAGNVHFVRVSINGIEGRFLLDTGSSYTSVNHDSSARFKLRPTRRVAEVKIANNSTIQVPVAYASVQMGRNTQHSATVLLLPPGEKNEFDGLLGGDFLRAFNGTIDVEHGRLILRGAVEGL